MPDADVNGRPIGPADSVPRRTAGRIVKSLSFRIGEFSGPLVGPFGRRALDGKVPGAHAVVRARDTRGEPRLTSPGYPGPEC